MNPLMTVLVGPPGSGKTTWADEYMENRFRGFPITRISQDDQGKEGHLDLFRKSVDLKHDIIVDRMNFNFDQRDRYLSVAKKAGYDTTIVVFHEPMQSCIDRCNKRKGHPTVKTEKDVQESVHFFFTNYGRVQDSEADEVIRTGWVDSSAIKTVVCDLDGTMANINHRLHYVKDRTTSDGRKIRPDWRGFFENMTKDRVNGWCKELVTIMSEKYPIVYATGRPADYKEQIEDWLEVNGLRTAGSDIHTRLKEDYRKDSIIKEIILEFEILTRYKVLFWVDDRKQVVDMLRSHGILVLQCAEGLF